MSDTAVKERPILMHGRSVRAILEGRKTQTRRIVNCPNHTTAIYWTEDDNTVPAGTYTGWVVECDAPLRLPLKCPYGQPGNRLKVREPLCQSANGTVVYAADRVPAMREGESVKWPWKVAKLAGRFCPNWAVRIRLELADVRAERVQSIGPLDAADEGIGMWHPDDYPHGYEEYPSVAEFRQLWNDTNGPGAWQRNDWVWVLTSKTIEPQSEAT